MRTSKPAPSNSPWAWISPMVLALIIAGLIVSNLLSLFSQQFHAMAYGLATQAVGALAGQAAVSRLVRESPSAVSQNRLAVAKQEMDGLRKVNAEWEAGYRELDRKHADLIARYRDLGSRYVDLEAGHRSLQDRYASLESRMARRTQAYRQFSANAAQRLARKKTVELSSLLERAVPYSGIPVTLSVAAYGLNSDCALLKEIHGLAREEGGEAADASDVCGFKLPSADEVRNHVKKHSADTQQRFDGLVERICDQFVRCDP